mgnify:CR=1 FL=1
MLNAGSSEMWVIPLTQHSNMDSPISISEFEKFMEANQIHPSNDLALIDSIPSAK